MAVSVTAADFVGGHPVVRVAAPSTWPYRPVPRIDGGVYDAVRVALGYRFGVAIRRNGSVVSWGQGDHGELGAGTGVLLRATAGPVSIAVPVIDVAAGNDHALALAEDGTVWVWGQNYNSQLGNGGTSPVYTPTQVVGITGAVAIGATQYSSIVATANGSIYRWGSENGLSVGTTPQLFATIPNVVRLETGRRLQIAVDSSGKLWNWGANAVKADGTYGSAVPVEVPVLANADHVSAGFDHAVAIKGTTLWGWGDRSDNQIAVVNQRTCENPTPDGCADPQPENSHLAGPGPFTWPIAPEAHDYLVAGAGYRTSAAAHRSGKLRLFGNDFARGSSDVDTKVVTAWPASFAAGRLIRGNFNREFVALASTLSLPLASTDGTMLGIWRVGPVSNLNTYYEYDGDAFKINGWQMITNLPPGWTIRGFADMNGDANREILLQNDTTGYLAAWLMKGVEIVGWQGITDVHPDWNVVGFVDMNSDTHPDILLQHKTNGFLGMWTMNGTTITGWQGITDIGAGWTIAGFADINWDAHPDILIHRAADGVVGGWTMNNTTITGWFNSGTIATDLRPRGFADFNFDGHPDMLVEKTDGSALSVMTMISNGITGTRAIGGVSPAWRSLGVSAF